LTRRRYVVNSSIISSDNIGKSKGDFSISIETLIYQKMDPLRAFASRQNISHTSNLTLNVNQFKPNNGLENMFSNELFPNLKRNYEGR